LLIARKLSFDIRLKDLYCRIVTLKVTYFNMKSITRSQSVEPTNKAEYIYKTASAMLDKIEKRPIRLVGITVSNFSDKPYLQMSLFDTGVDDRKDKLNDAMMKLQLRYGKGIVKTVNELRAEKRFEEE